MRGLRVGLAAAWLLAACGGSRGDPDAGRLDAIVIGRDVPGVPADLPTGDRGPDGAADALADADPDGLVDTTADTADTPDDPAADAAPDDLPPAFDPGPDLPADPGVDPGVEPADPGSPDPGTADPGALDPGPVDVGPLDPGSPDLGPADPGPADLGPADPGSAEVFLGQCRVDADCDDQDPCTQDTCLPGNVCSHPLATGPACDDGDPCTGPDLCRAGSCIPGEFTCECASPAACDDGNPCTDDTCPAGTCVHGNNAAACDDGDGCTVGDACQGGACGAGPLDCGAPGCAGTHGCPSASCTQQEDIGCGENSWNFADTDVIGGSPCGIPVGWDGQYIYRFRPTQARSVTVRVSFSGTLDDTYQLFVLEGVCDASTCIGRDTGGSWEEVKFQAQAGRTYYLVVGYDAWINGNGDHNLKVTCN